MHIGNPASGGVFCALTQILQITKNFFEKIFENIISLHIFILSFERKLLCNQTMAYEKPALLDSYTHFDHFFPFHKLE